MMVVVVWLFLTMPRVCVQLVIVVFPDHTHLLFWSYKVRCENAKVSLGFMTRCGTEKKLKRILPETTSSDGISIYFVYLRNEFDLWNVHGIMTTSGLLQSK